MKITDRWECHKAGYWTEKVSGVAVFKEPDGLWHSFVTDADEAAWDKSPKFKTMKLAMEDAERRMGDAM